MKWEILIPVLSLVGMFFFGAVWFFTSAIWAEILSLLCMGVQGGIAYILSKEF